MKIENGVVATLAYDITTVEGEIVENSDISGPISILVGQQSLIPGLDSRIIGLVAGDEKTFEIPPAEAFGTTETAPTNEMNKAEFPAGTKFEVGQGFEAKLPTGQSIYLKIVKVADDKVTVAMLHPLADKTLTMSVRIVGVRPATAKEKESGKAMVKPPPPPPKK
jgi:FKBP-type peptidyl-prolyl cis-trans isomerase SlyD